MSTLGAWRSVLEQRVDRHNDLGILRSEFPHFPHPFFRPSESRPGRRIHQPNIRDVEDAAAVSLEFEGGAVGTLNAGYYLDRGYDNEIRLWGSLGWLRFNPHAEATLESYSTHPQAPRGLQQFRPPKESAHDLMLQSAVEAQQGSRPWFMSTQDSLEVLRVVFAAYRSAETGRAQDISG